MMLFSIFFRRDINMHITERDEKYNHDRLFHHLCPAVCRMHKVLFSKAFHSRGDQQTDQAAPSQLNRHSTASSPHANSLNCSVEHVEMKKNKKPLRSN